MKSSRWFFPIFLCFVFVAPASAPADEAAPAVAGKVITVNGTVLIRSGVNPNAKAEVLKAGTFFHSSDIINTPSDGSVKLLLNDRSIIDIKPSTLFHVNSFEAKQGGNREVDLSMDYGAVRFAVTKPLQGQGKFKIRTPTATMGVRGTDGEVGHDLASQKSFGSIVSGLGSFSTNAGAGVKPVTISLPAGTTVTLAPQKVGMPPALPAAASKIPPAQLASYKQAVQKNDTFRNSVEVKASTPSNAGSASKGSEGTKVAKNENKDKEKEKEKDKEKDGKKGDDKGGTSTTRAPATSVAASGSSASSSSSGSAESTGSANAGTSTTGAAPAPEAPAVVNTTLAIATVEVTTTVATAPPIEVPIVAPVVVPAAPVVVPAGGLRHITIRVTR